MFRFLRNKCKVSNVSLKAFTFVETAVVITIIGLLMAGTLAGIQILNTSKTVSTIAQIENYKAAVSTFEKTYGSLPGDMADADKRIRDCKPSSSSIGCILPESGGSVATYQCQEGMDAYCNGCPSSGVFPCTSTTTFTFPNPSSCNGGCASMGYTFGTCSAKVCTYDYHYETVDGLYDTTYKASVATGQVGDGAIGPVSWDMLTERGQYVVGTGAIDTDNAVDAEVILFWYELFQAGLINGVTDAGVYKYTSKTSFGKTYPYSEIGGGFWIGHNDGGIEGRDDEEGNISAGRPYGAGVYTLNGNILTLVRYAQGSSDQYTQKPIYLCTADLSGEFTCDIKKSNEWGINNLQNDNPTTPKLAYEIDSKIDDGLPNLGSIQAYGDPGYCYKGQGNKKTLYSDAGLQYDVYDSYVYDLTADARYCGLYIKISE